MRTSLSFFFTRENFNCNAPPHNFDRICYTYQSFIPSSSSVLIISCWLFPNQNTCQWFLKSFHFQIRIHANDYWKNEKYNCWSVNDYRLKVASEFNHTFVSIRQTRRQVSMLLNTIVFLNSVIDSIDSSP